MGEFLIIMGLVVFYNLFKIIFNIIRVIFLKKKVKKFLKIDLISEIIYFLGWINLMRNAIILVPSQIFHSVFYCVAILIFLINKRNKKIHNYILFSIITIDIIIVLFLLNMLKLYLITVITIIVYIFVQLSWPLQQCLSFRGKCYIVKYIPIFYLFLHLQLL